MQTFVVCKDLKASAKILDNKRLGKQRVEAIQLANSILGLSVGKGWKNHPATKMWKNYAPFLIKHYLKSIIDEWVERGFKNTKCQEHFDRLSLLVENEDVVEPNWFTSDFFDSHKSNLMRKNRDHYSKFFDIRDDLDYIWPGNYK